MIGDRALVNDVPGAVQDADGVADVAEIEADGVLCELNR